VIALRAEFLGSCFEESIMDQPAPTTATTVDSPPYSVGAIVRLSIMMFLQYFVWGIWLPVLNFRLEELQIRPGLQGIIGTVYGFGAVLGPFVIGALADRYFSTEKVLAFAHIVGGFLLFATGYMTTFWPIFILLFIYCNLYMPSMGLTNSITFRSLGPERQNLFPPIRTLGTIGWVAAGWFYAGYLSVSDSSGLKPLFDLVGKPGPRDCLRVAGVLSVLYGLYCFLLPHTPPVPAKPTDPVDKRSAILETLELMRSRSFAILVITAALIGIMLAFYFQCEGVFLRHIGIQQNMVGFYMSFGQIAEILVMLLVPFTVSRLGVKRTMLLGAGAWALRFGLSVLGQPQWLMISTITLHGFCFGFFFVVAQMFVDRAASPDIKASAQNLLIFLVYGVGTVVGNLLGGALRDYFGSNWAGVWAGPFVLTVLCMIAFALLFKEEEIRKPVAQPDAVLA
jgi:nucleoside transporter